MLAPQDCFVCGAESAGDAVCEACAGALPDRPQTACPRCGLPGLGGGCCAACERDKPAYDATLALYDFVFPVDAMVHALKYRHRLSMASFFGAALAARAQDFGAQADLILPMPLHPRRLAERGFNQALELARPLARARGLPLGLAVVRKMRDIPAQAGLDREARLRNPRGVFECDVSLHGQRVIVVDDVMTTGATLGELARTLKRQGASWVGNLVVARTPAPY
ncbi:ComF family protein [Thauera sp.]|uniref:ComF family protein n=1 Tax=Thauera sp. TaxID=1905334 RepID=UPI002A36B133|nr:ComF family protein [Thauera sp.]MDX9885632.1 ComF family protein [Thauera sp.]